MSICSVTSSSQKLLNRLERRDKRKGTKGEQVSVALLAALRQASPMGPMCAQQCHSQQVCTAIRSCSSGYKSAHEAVSKHHQLLLALNITQSAKAKAKPKPALLHGCHMSMMAFVSRPCSISCSPSCPLCLESAPPAGMQKDAADLCLPCAALCSRVCGSMDCLQLSLSLCDVLCACLPAAQRLLYT